VIDRPFVFRDYRIPVGALVCNSPTFAHLSEENYERPREFWPERWIGTAELEHSTMTARYMPFGTFAHICPGKRFSYLWLKMSVVELLRRFDLEPIGPCPGVREGIMPVLGNRDGPRLVRYRRR
jgi:cytochrome P450